MRWLVLMTALPLLATMPATANGLSDHWRDCKQQADPDRGVAGCSWIISGFSGTNNVWTLAVAHYQRGIAHYYKGNQTELNDGDQTGSLQAGGEMDETDAALSDYNKAIELKTDFVEAYFSRGLAYDQRGDLDRAIADYDKAIELKPEYADAYYSRGLDHERKGDLAQALIDLSKAVELDPESGAKARVASVVARINEIAAEMAQKRSRPSVEIVR